MLLNTIKIKNFRGFEEHGFSFDESSLVILTAPNGNGKTSLIDAIEWCLTGNIYRLQRAFEKRNTNAGERRSNKNAILKNKNHLREETVVTLELCEVEKTYILTRLQSEDTLEHGGKIKIEINGEEIEDPEKELAKIVNKKTFYKYHFCDMQKTYNFLHNSRGDMESEFEDFSSDYSEAENVVKNLEIYQEDIRQRITVKNGEKVQAETLEVYRQNKEKYQDATAIQPYNAQKLYEAEWTNVEKLTIAQIGNQLEVLCSCGYGRAVTVLERINDSEAREKCQKSLEILRTELQTKKPVVEDAIKKSVYKEDVLTAAEKRLKQYNELKLTEENLVGNSETLFKIRNTDFTETYWNESSKKLNGIKERLENLNNEMEILSKGNKVLDILVSVVVGKSNLIQYRKEMRTQNPGVTVRCPVCGSEDFDCIEEQQIAKQAENYQAEHKELIEKKKKEVTDLQAQEKELLEEQLGKARNALKHVIEETKKEVECLTNLYQQSKVYFDIVNELQKKDEEKYSIENLDSEEKVLAAINENKELIIPRESKEELQEELKRIFAIVNYSAEGKTMETQMMEMKKGAEKMPENISYNESLLADKIHSLRSYQENTEFLNVSKKLEDAEEKNKQIDKKIEELEQLAHYAKDRVEQINQVKNELKKKEYAQVGPYLYKIFRKLSRDVQIESINLKNEKEGKVSLLDEKGYSLLNMFSDGQLSVFMLSYFLGNIFRMSETEKIPVYFVDDITACMDDINMLAFLDFIKYQLSEKNNAMKQLFFVTCDKRIEDLMKYKMQSCGISYKEIDMQEFRGGK